MLLGLLFGLAGMGSSSAALVLPQVAAEFDTTVGVAAWTISGYVLLLAVSTAVYGRVADLVGVRGPLLFGIGLMTTGALVAAIAPTFSVLLTARLFQGAGAAAVSTLGVAVLSSRYDGSVRGLALGRLAAVAAAVSAVGPLIGGVVELAFGWRAVMALPLLGALVLPAVWHTLTKEGSGARLDILGAVLVALTAGGLILLVQSPSTGLAVAVTGVLLMVLGAPLVAHWVRRNPHGFLPHEVITNGTVVRSALAAASMPASWFALLIGVPAVMVDAGWQPWQVGLLLLPTAVVAMQVPSRAGPLLDRRGGAWTLAVAGVLSAASLLTAALATALVTLTDQSWITVVASVILMVSVMLCAVSFGMGQPALMATVGDAVEAHVRGVAIGVATLMFLVGGSVGSAVIAGLGALVGIPISFAVLALLPVLALVVLGPELKRAALV